VKRASVLDDAFHQAVKDAIDFNTGMSNSDIDRVIDNIMAGQPHWALQGMTDDAVSRQLRGT